MHGVVVLYEDQWGAIVDRMVAGHLEIRWFDTTAEMSTDVYQDWLTRFAEEVGANRRPGVLVDATRFRMPRANMDDRWHDEWLTPRYNAAGVRRLAFLVPDGTVSIGSDPTCEEPAEFSIAHFGRRQNALAWLGEGSDGNPSVAGSE